MLWSWSDISSCASTALSCHDLLHCIALLNDYVLVQNAYSSPMAKMSLFSVANFRISCSSFATFRHIPLDSMPLSRPQNRVHRQGVVADAGMIEALENARLSWNGLLALRVNSRCILQTSRATEFLGQTFLSNWGYLVVAVYPHTNEFSQRPHYIWRHCVLQPLGLASYRNLILRCIPLENALCWRS